MIFVALHKRNLNGSVDDWVLLQFSTAQLGDETFLAAIFISREIPVEKGLSSRLRHLDQLRFDYPSNDQFRLPIEQQQLAVLVSPHFVLIFR